MEEYVLDASGISLCNISSAVGCSAKELAFATIWRETKSLQEASQQLQRLSAVSKQSSKTKPELQKWLKQRIAVLKQVVALAATSSSSTEVGESEL